VKTFESGEGRSLKPVGSTWTGFWNGSFNPERRF